MKKILMLGIILALCFSFSKKSWAEENCTEDDSYDRQQSLVIYHYKDSNGEDQRLVAGQRSDMPEELKNKCWECWVDVMGWFNCSEK